MIWISNPIGNNCPHGRHTLSEGSDTKANHRNSGSSISLIFMGFHTIHVVLRYDASAPVWWPPTLSAASALADMHIPKRHVHPPGKYLKGAIQHKHTLNWSSLIPHPPYDLAWVASISLLHTSGTVASYLYSPHPFHDTTLFEFSRHLHIAFGLRKHTWQRPSGLDCS